MSNVRVWRCQICGDTYLGVNWPSNCPYCGASFDYLDASKDYPLDIQECTPTEAECKDLETAMDIEITNLTFYRQLGKLGDTRALIPSAYRALAKIETEHLIVFAKALGTTAPTEPANPLTVQDSFAANIAASHKREEEASAFYAEAAARATTPRIKQIFTAISAVEADHMEIDNFLLEVAKDTLA